MAKRNVPDEGCSEEGGKWFNSLSVEEVVDLKWLQDYGVQDEEDQEKPDKFRASYERSTGETWE
jgi:hypothetical protein